MIPLLQGMAIGLSIAAPVGPIGLLCIRRALADGRLAGLVSGLGAATADALYGVIAALGITAITTLLIEYRAFLQVAGGLFLVYLGLTTLRAKSSAEEIEAPSSTTLRSAYFSTLALTLANPMTIVSFIGIFAGLGVGAANAGPLAGMSLVAGVFLGSAAWWLLLSFTASAFRGRLRAGGRNILNLVSGLILCAFGGVQLAELL
jgi:threonine/homoserine/homoserine lactone efflux protein